MHKSSKNTLIDEIRVKSRWVWEETLKIHRIAQGTRLASSLSCVEILSVLYYGGFVKNDPKDIYNENRDRFIASKAHGSVSFYPILADLGYFGADQLAKVGKNGGQLGDIPDCSIPGFETANGSLGYGLGVGCGVSIALKKKKLDKNVFVLCGDGEMNEGSIWEAVMFAGQNKLDNLVLVIDNNKICMLDYCRKIIDLEPFEEKFKSFGWEAVRANGHDIKNLFEQLTLLLSSDFKGPKVLIADTVKGKGVRSLESDSLCHVKALKPNLIDNLLKEINENE